MSPIPAIINGLKALFGGGSAYVYLVLAGGIGYLWIDYKDALSDAERYEKERDDALEVIEERNSTIKSLAIQSNRQQDIQKDTDDAQTAINAVPDSNFCANSEPIRAGLDWLRDFEARKGQIDDGSPNVPMPSPSKDAE